jgi:hypothetical protein
LELDERYKDYVQEIITNDYSKLYVQLIASNEKKKRIPSWFQKPEIVAKIFSP